MEEVALRSTSVVIPCQRQITVVVEMEEEECPRRLTVRVRAILPYGLVTRLFDAQMPD